MVGHDLSQAMIGDGIFEMSKGVRSAALPAGLSVVCPCTVVSHYQGYRFHFVDEGDGYFLPLPSGKQRKISDTFFVVHSDNSDSILFLIGKKN